MSSNRIEFEGKTYVLSPGERALASLVRQGAPVPFSCRKGACHSCMLQAISGDPGRAATERLPADYVARGFFLPCCAVEFDNVVAVRPDLSLITHNAIVAGKETIGKGILRLRLESETEVTWQPGQNLGLIAPGGEIRRYTIVSQPQDYFLDLHIRVYEDGAVSGWLASAVSEGDMIRYQGPAGAFFYRDELAGIPLILIGTGTGGGAIAGVARDAVSRGHRAQVRIFHGGRLASDLYLGPELAALAAASPDVTVTEAASREGAAGRPAARITDLALLGGADLSGHALFLCGVPEVVETARVRAIRLGIPPERIFSDPYEAAQPFMPDETPKMRAVLPDPGLWAALDDGGRLTAILTDFYAEVYEDPRLAPFFHRVTRQRAAEKQYSFLRDMICGTRDYFGEKPFNAHHWMVISDDLFDYRERMMKRIALKHGLAGKHWNRWAALHELFRREIVKSAARGVIRGGVEVDLEGYTEEVTEIATVCDACTGEIPAGGAARMHKRTGQLFCPVCSGQLLATGESPIKKGE